MQEKDSATKWLAQIDTDKNHHQNLQCRFVSDYLSPTANNAYDSGKAKHVVLTQGASKKNMQADKNKLHDRKWISEKTKHRFSETVRGTFLGKESVQPKEGLADQEHNYDNT